VSRRLKKRVRVRSESATAKQPPQLVTELIGYRGKKFVLALERLAPAPVGRSLLVSACVVAPLLRELLSKYPNLPGVISDVV
jgi:hypothetical protein